MRHLPYWEDTSNSSQVKGALSKALMRSKNDITPAAAAWLGQADKAGMGVDIEGEGQGGLPTQTGGA